MCVNYTTIQRRRSDKRDTKIGTAVSTVRQGILPRAVGSPALL